MNGINQYVAPTINQTNGSQCPYLLALRLVHTRWLVRGARAVKLGAFVQYIQSTYKHLHADRHPFSSGKHWTASGLSPSPPRDVPAYCVLTPLSVDKGYSAGAGRSVLFFSVASSSPSIPDSGRMSTQGSFLSASFPVFTQRGLGREM